MAFRPQDTLTISRLIDPKLVEIDKSGHKALITIPGLTLEDIDRTGNIDICSIVRLTTTARTMAYYNRADDPNSGPGFLSYRQLTDEYFMFLACAETTVSESFYEVPASGSPPRLAVSVHLGRVGKSSLQSVATVLDRDTNARLAQNINVMVCVDKSTRKPFPLPNWWTSRYMDAVCEPCSLKVVPEQVPQQVTYRVRSQVPWHEVDPYRHATYLCYVRMCQNCAMEAMRNQLYSEIKGDDILLHRIRKLTVLHKQESTGGDDLDISTWENKESACLNFDISKRGGAVFQAMMYFYKH